MGTPKQEKRRSKKARRKRRIIIFIIEIVILLILLACVYLYSLYAKMKNPRFNKDELIRNEEVDAGATEGFETIALFGLDSRDIESLGKGNLSDTIIIANINNKTKEVKLASVYRDTYLNMTNDTYNKANSAYLLGGPEKAISMLNMNLDLTIDKYVTINFMALVEVIDALGGLEIDVQEDEWGHLNNYQVETRLITGKESPDIAGPGLQVLNGVQATSYCRIRYTVGDDFKRTERQRLVISKIIDKIKDSDVGTLSSIINSITDNNYVNTNIEVGDILKLASGAKDYELGETTGFPFTKTTDPHPDGLDAVVPCGLAYNVSQLHAFLYGKEDYQVSTTVQSISDYIINKTGAETKEIVEETSADTTEADSEY